MTVRVVLEFCVISFCFLSSHSSRRWTPSQGFFLLQCCCVDASVLSVEVAAFADCEVVKI